MVEKTYTLAEAAPIIGVKVKTLRKWRAEGKFKGSQPGREILISESEITMLQGGAAPAAEKNEVDPDIAAAEKEQALAEARMKTRLADAGFQKIEEFEKAKKDAEDWVKNQNDARQSHQEALQKLADRERAVAERERQVSIALGDAKAVIERAKILEPLAEFRVEIKDGIQAIVANLKAIKELPGQGREQLYDIYNKYGIEACFDDLFLDTKALIAGWNGLILSLKKRVEEEGKVDVKSG